MKDSSVTLVKARHFAAVTTVPNGAPSSMIDPTSKTFVLDTNVLLHNPEALLSFDDNRVVIPDYGFGRAR